MKEFSVRLVSAIAVVCIMITYNAVAENRKLKDENNRLMSKCEGMQIDQDKIIRAFNSVYENEASFNDIADGVYFGSAQGFDGEIEVSVEIESGKIKTINIVSVGDDDYAFFESAKSVIDIMIANQSVEVDVISGATFSSRGIIDATKNAIEKAIEKSESDN